MSDTPRTDELLNTITENTLLDVFGAQLIEHALSLERELAAALEDAERYRRLAERYRRRRGYEGVWEKNA
jgi:hypothetical protein